MGTRGNHYCFGVRKAIHLLLVMFALAFSALAKGQVPLLGVTPESQDTSIRTLKSDKDVRAVSNHCLFRGDLIFVDGYKGEGVVSFRLGKKYSFLHFRALGLMSAWSRNSLDTNLVWVLNRLSVEAGSSAFAIEGDGKPLSSGMVNTLGPLKDQVIDISNVDLLKIHLSDRACLFDAQLTKFGIASDKKVEPVQPRDGSAFRDDHVRFEWSMAGMKSSYYVLVTASNVAEDGGKGKCWVFPSGAATFLDVDAKVLPDGEYVWQVLSLGLSGKAGEYSTTSGFSLSRHNSSGISPLPDLTMQSRVVPFGDRFVLGAIPFPGGDSLFFGARTDYSCLEVPAGADRLVLECDTTRATPTGGDILFDGSPYKRVDLQGGQARASMSVPISSAQSVAISGPLLSVSGFTGTFYSVPAPQLTGPDDGSTAKSDTTWLRWSAVEGADHYVVRVIPTSVLVQPSPDSVKILDVGSVPQLLVNVKEWPPGWYEWQVQAFAGKQIYGKWSLPFQLQIKKS